MAKSFQVLNKQGGELAVVVDGNEQGKATLLFVQGFGVSLAENSLLADITTVFRNEFTIISFDFAGYGASAGKQEDVSLDKEAQDLDSILRWVKKEFLGPIFLLAHSLGCAVVSHLNPSNIEKTIFIAPTQQNSDTLVKELQRRMQLRGGKIDEQDISVYPRLNGEVQNIGASFWSTLRAFNPVAAMRKYSLKTNLLIIYPRQDEIIAKEHLLKYKALPTLTFKELAGDHNFSKEKERMKLINLLHTFLQEQPLNPPSSSSMI